MAVGEKLPSRVACEQAFGRAGELGRGNPRYFFPQTESLFIGYVMGSLRGRRSKGNGKAIRARDHARGRREEGRTPRAPHAL